MLVLSGIWPMTYDLWPGLLLSMTYWCTKYVLYMLLLCTLLKPHPLFYRGESCWSSMYYIPEADEGGGVDNGLDLTNCDYSYTIAVVLSAVFWYSNQPQQAGPLWDRFSLLNAKSGLHSGSGNCSKHTVCYMYLKCPKFWLLCSSSKISPLIYLLLGSTWYLVSAQVQHFFCVWMIFSTCVVSL